MLFASSFQQGLAQEATDNTDILLHDEVGNKAVSALSIAQYSHAEQRFTPQEMYQLAPKTWRQWLSGHSVFGIRKLRTASLYTTGCGISMKVDFRSNATASTKLAASKIQHSAYFKHSTTDMSHYDAESHLREIKAYYLDRLLETNVVLPCVGHVLYRDSSLTMLTREQQVYVDKHTKCAASQDDEGISGSLMLWLDGIKQIPHKKIIEIALAPPKTASNTSNSALHYAIFHYVGGCMKSDHNHFYYKNQEKRQIHFTAIDNDRCFTPEAISFNKTVVPKYHRERLRQWERMLFQDDSAGALCQNPVAKSLMSQRGRPLLSQQLQQELGKDSLATQLLASQPETFGEMDSRVAKLVEHLLETCGDDASSLAETDK